MSNPSDFAEVANVISALAEAGGKTKRGKDAIPAAQRVGAAIGESTGVGRAATDPASSGSGVASPFTEPNADLRKYHPAQDVFTEDGNIVKVWPIQFMRMKDANGNLVEFNFDLPDYASITE